MLALALTARFALEVCLLSVVGWFAYRLSPGWKGAGLSVAAVALLAITWGALLSPRRPVEIGELSRLLLELALFALAAAALYSRGHWQLATALILIELVDKLALSFLER